MPLLDRVVEKYPNDVKLVAKSFPLRNHQYANMAASVALAAEEKGKFWEVREKLMENYSSLDQEKIFELARNAGLSDSELTNSLRDRRIAAMIRKDTEDGRRAGVRGTPSIFINGRRLNNRSLEGFSAVIEEELSSGYEGYESDEEADE